MPYAFHSAFRVGESFEADDIGPEVVRAPRSRPRRHGPAETARTRGRMMGSAFYNDGCGGPDVVLFRQHWDDEPELVVHCLHPECEREWPHLMADCGRFRRSRSDHTAR